MALYITIKSRMTPTELLAEIKDEIDHYTIRTWTYNAQNHFFHDTKSDQWNEGGYLVPHIDDALPDTLVFSYKVRRGTHPREGTESQLYTRIGATIMNHFPGLVELSIK